MEWVRPLKFDLGEKLWYYVYRKNEKEVSNGVSLYYY